MSRDPISRRQLLAAGVAGAAFSAGAKAGMIGLGLSIPEVAVRQGLPLPIPVVSADFVNNAYVGGAFADLFTFTRASTKTNLHWNSPPGFVWSSFPSDVPAKTADGIAMEAISSNLLLNSATPATQGVTLTAGTTYWLWMRGPGSTVVTWVTGAGRIIDYDTYGRVTKRRVTSSTTNTSIEGRLVSITPTTTGTALFTVVGTVTEFQLDSRLPSSFIPTGGASVNSVADSLALAGAANTAIRLAAATIVIWLKETVRTGTGARIFEITSRILQTNNYDGGYASVDTVGTNPYYFAAGQGRGTSGVGIGVAWDATKRLISVNGGACSQGTKMKNGSSGATCFIGNTAGIFVSRIEVYDFTLSDAQLRAVTGKGLPYFNAVCIGDSIVEQVPGYSTTYQTMISQMLSAATGKVVMNAGRNGDKLAPTSGGVSPGIAAKYLADPTLWDKDLYIIAGYNDIGADPNTMLGYIQQMVSACTAARIVIGTIINGPPRANPSTGYTQTLAFNALLISTFASHPRVRIALTREAMVAGYNPKLPADVVNHDADSSATSLRVRGVATNSVDDVSASATSWTVESGASLASGTAFQFGDEIVLIGTVSGNVVSGVTRGYNGSAAVAHPAGTEIWLNTADSIHPGELGRQAMVAALLAA